ncbi:pyridoxal-phosphate-dependent aminotransferase family protein [Picrophilus oshimae]|uniref:Aspartate aminotransferase n=1 Tax=Picrophilus torridus (strain ATCC 700027 / DSM 9790 / JCM 10055 / NBRC 100828 / KAW 2/3) TaxID=1122961 RepID=A0A8G2L7B7_PICTO|nr:alanine--glyoxylate aminotransferase family protein [Picrophilus oshimae]SMD30913.1 aspartate aminotransferase [Picrophilus oshimae DSM 9789]
MSRRLLMHVGPVTIDNDVLSAGLVNNAGFASPEFVEAMKYALNGFLYTVKSGNYMPFILPGSGTLAMESMTSFLKPNDSVLIISNGVFGDRWKNIFSRYNLNIDYLKAPPGRAVSLNEIENIKKHYRMAVMTHVETSTGVRFDVKSAAGILRNISDIIVADGVASISGENMEADKWDVDVVFTASQKALGAPPGAALLAISPEAVSELNDVSLSGFYNNLYAWKDIMTSILDNKSAYYTTPPVHIVFSLARAFELIKKEGIDERIKRHYIVAESIRSGIDGLGLEIVAGDDYKSNTVTAVMIDNPSEFISGLYSKNIEIASGVVPELKDRYVRIGHMGWLNINDAAATVSAMERVLHEMKYNISPGQGLKRMQEFLFNNNY